jgi:hypothetical protein
MEIARIGIHLNDQNLVDVGAPMQRKDICYEMLKAAEHVIARTPEQHFSPAARTLTIVMGSSGTIDVAAPLPSRKLAADLLRLGREVIERFNDDKAPELRPFSAAVMGGV